MTAIYQSRERANEAAERLKIYAQPQRLMILSFLLAGERTVGEIETATAIGQPALSQQLAELRRAELVETRRAAKQIFYKLADARVALCVRCVEAIFEGAGDPEAALAEALRGPSARSEPRSRAGAASFAKIMP
ncbi:metalloregulator ArsR/SmtB family transcription factor [Methylosinus sp. Sm6]|uniref:ArsR/SmtB family transcription factor n=1 Tax=Methylosinus sp. Sm6 TaxID=2866948 RepID=UPI001C9A2449|nr:metalloregulator ArsR/SmtB family transcription factor [Methylosinus sp. Sm6]MBY6241734.1 metalloregulator ArsR/SmtB family transcription factor [Methylosinus sp. Sm6]